MEVHRTPKELRIYNKLLAERIKIKEKLKIIPKTHKTRIKKLKEKLRQINSEIREYEKI